MMYILVCSRKYFHRKILSSVFEPPKKVPLDSFVCFFFFPSKFLCREIENFSRAKSRYRISSVQFSSVQSLSCVWLFVTPWIAACEVSLSITNSRNSPRVLSIESVMPSNHLILCRSLLLLPPIPPSIRVLSNESRYRILYFILFS